MAADTIRSYLETGEIVNSVNFPTTKLPMRSLDTIRINIVNENKPGVLAAIMNIFGDAGVNIQQQLNTSRGDIAYNVIDVEKPTASDDPSSFTYKSWNELQRAITALEGIKSTRFLDNRPGTGYAIQYDGKVYGIDYAYPENKTWSDIKEP